MPSQHASMYSKMFTSLLHLYCRLFRNNRFLENFCRFQHFSPLQQLSYCRVRRQHSPLAKLKPTKNEKPENCGKKELHFCVIESKNINYELGRCEKTRKHSPKLQSKTKTKWEYELGLNFLTSSKLWKFPLPMQNTTKNN